MQKGKQGELVTFCMSRVKQERIPYAVQPYDPFKQVEIERKWFARKVLKSDDNGVAVRLENRTMYLPHGNYHIVG